MLTIVISTHFYLTKVFKLKNSLKKSSTNTSHKNKKTSQDTQKKCSENF